MQRYKVVLYNPKAVFYTMPLGLMAIGSYLDAGEYEVVIVDGRLYKDPLPVLFGLLNDNAVVFATSVLTGSPIKDALQVSGAVKQKFPHIPVVWGGWHPSLFPHETLQDENIDVVVRGQGEITFARLLQHFVSQQTLHGIPGIAFKENGHLVMNAERHLANINEFPPFNYQLINVKDYMKLSGRNQIDYISSQGCRFRCAFCADPAMYKRGWHGYSPERIGKELEQLWKQYQFEHVHFQDETFFTSRKRVEGIAREIINRELPITWFATMRADQGVRLPDEVWHLCKLSGLEKIMVGMEAGTQEMLDWMQKDIKVHQLFETAEQCMRYNIAISFSIIVGFPGETEQSIDATLDVAKQLRKMSSNFSVNIFYYKPYPGNKIADELSATGYHFPAGLEEWSNFDYVDSGKSDWISDKKIKEIEAFKFYQHIGYSKPRTSKYLLQQIARWRCENKLYAFPIEKALINYLRPKQKMS